jgi:hypothetical protein
VDGDLEVRGVKFDDRKIASPKNPLNFEDWPGDVATRLLD